MGTSLTGLTVSATYNALLKTTDNLVLSGVLRLISDGLGNDSALQISTAGIASTGTLAVTGASAFTGAVSGAGITALFASPPSIGNTAPGTGAFTTISATGAITSTLATGTAPLTVASTTVVANLNASFLGGFTFPIPGTIGSTTPNSGAFTTLAASGAVSGAGFTALFASPPAIGGTVAAAALFTTLGLSGTLTGAAANYSGQVAAASFNETSARRFKENITPLMNALETALALQPVAYNVIGDHQSTVGFIADDVRPLLPSLVYHNEAGEVQGLNYARITAVNTGAIHELAVRIVELERKAA